MESFISEVSNLVCHVHQNSFDGSKNPHKFVTDLGLDIKSFFFDDEDDEEDNFELAEDEIIKELLTEGVANEKQKKKRRVRINKRVQFSDTVWGQYICDDNVNNPHSREGKLFRRRFRLPFPVFQFFVSLCRQHNIFNSTYESKIPIEAKVLACLRILGRGNCADDINEMSATVMGESTINTIFKTFIAGVVKHIYPSFIKPPEGALLQKVLKEFELIGLPGCVGSMDCTHARWLQCPKGEKHNSKGKEGYPTVAFQVVVSHSRRVLSVSPHYLGNINDKTICKNDIFSLSIMHGSLQDVQYQLWNSAGQKYNCKGGYLIVDGGYIDHICFIEPEKYRLTKDSVHFAEWMESVRKDVECFFALVKNRWRLLLNAIMYHKAIVIEHAFKTACCLHNMILIYDETVARLNKAWEDVQWENLDPDGDDEADDETDDTATIPAVVNDLEEEVVPVTERTVVVRNQPVHEFTVKMPKQDLKVALQTSFTVQWVKNQLFWPKRFSAPQKNLLPLQRAQQEMYRALYHKESNLRKRDQLTREYTERLKTTDGLFSRLQYKRDDVIVSFKGTHRTEAEYKALCDKEPWRRAYSLLFSSTGEGDVLDCFDAYQKGTCVASYANSPKGCIDIVTGKKAVPNCRLVVNHLAKTMSLKCGVDTISRVSPKTL